MRHAMEDSGDTRSLRSRTDVTAETNVEERHDANVAHSIRRRYGLLLRRPNCVPHSSDSLSTCFDIK